MKKIFNWAAGLFRDEKGSPSSKRFVGIVCGLTLCVTMYSNSFTEAHFAPSESLVNAVTALAFGCLGLASIDKIFAKKDNTTPPNNEPEI
jgi:hypothetical protein